MNLSYHISMSGIRIAEHKIATAQNNIANAKNPSYARQRVEVGTSAYMGLGSRNSQLGTGAIIDQIKRITDDLLIQQSRTEMGRIGTHETISELLGSIENSFSELDGNSISKLTQSFFNSFEEASKFPEQSSYRVNIISSGQMFANKVKEVSAYLDNISGQIDTRIMTELSEVNYLIDSIGKINLKIQNSTTKNPNAMLDERDRYLDELAKYIDIDVIEGSNIGDIQVITGNVTLVSGTETSKINAKLETMNKNWVLGVDDIELKLKDGSMNGLLKTKNEIIENYKDELNTYVVTIMNEINSLHREGYGLDGSTDLDFFSGHDMRTIGINEILIDDVSKIGISSELGISGNSDIADSIKRLEEEAFIKGKTPLSYYQEFVINMANTLENSKELLETHRNIQSQFESHRQSVQGVDVDEELVNLTQYQQFYQANAKTMSIANSLLDQLLAIV